jgi:hypothetical protein
MVCFSLPSRAFITVEVGAECPYSDLKLHRPSDTGAAYPHHRGTADDDGRHRPGDTWMIGGKPYDPDDPGVWPWKPDPTYRRDRRTGRHRRGELPDPLPTTENTALQAKAHRATLPQQPITERKPRPSPPPASKTYEGRAAAPPLKPAEPAAPGEAYAELAWTRFLHFSEPLLRAHTEPPQPGWPVRAIRKAREWCAAVTATRSSSWAR